jgi:magnesium chelatase subunit H
LATNAPFELSAAKRIQKLGEQILELEYTLIPHGLHVVGKAPSDSERVDMLMAMAEASYEAKPTRAAIEVLVAGSTPAKALSQSGLTGQEAHAVLFDKLADANRLMMMNSELNGLIAAMDARYIRPAPGGDIMRTPEVLPTGRNLHGFDPFRIPSAYAVKDGATQADKLIARFQQDGNPLPESVAMVLWGSDNLKTEGSQIAQVLRLYGAKPRFDSYGRLVGASLIPLTELGRPRIDVVVTLSGIFRDLMPLQIKLIAEAALLAAQADESPEDNFVRKHALAYQAEHGCDLETAALRVFGNADGAYGSNVNNLVENGCWEDEDELGDMFAKRKSFAHGRHGQRVYLVLRHAGFVSRGRSPVGSLECAASGHARVDAAARRRPARRQLGS